MTKTLYLVRHGQPQPNTGIAYDRVPGPPLSAAGRAEARVTGLYLAGERIESLTSSPLDRAHQTAQIIAEETGLPAIVDDALREMRYDEPYDAVRERMRRVLADLVARPERALAFVSHGSPVRAALQLLSDDTIDLSGYQFDGNPLPTAGVWTARQTATGWDLAFAFQPQRPSGNPEVL
ncbi:MAG: histidine phosphatase family protein [Thermoflexales bacterium]|nr:histidine phosphatase family protein [Thermoflexales bacterium]